jgi:hypothetical protein
VVSRPLPSSRVGDPAWVAAASARAPPAAAVAVAASSPPHCSASLLPPCPPRRRRPLLGRRMRKIGSRRPSGRETKEKKWGLTGRAGEETAAGGRWLCLWIVVGLGSSVFPSPGDEFDTKLQ